MPIFNLRDQKEFWNVIPTVIQGQDSTVGKKFNVMIGSQGKHGSSHIMIGTSMLLGLRTLNYHVTFLPQI